METHELVDRALGLSIVDVGFDLIQEDKHPKRKGAGHYRGDCPFNEMHSADGGRKSFYLRPDKNIFRCYGCRKIGGPVTLAMKMLGKDETVKYISNKIGDGPENTERVSKFLDYLLEHEFERFKYFI